MIGPLPQGGTSVVRPREAVDHPEHYGGDTVYEAIKVIEAWELGFCLGNTVKYISRAERKGNRLEDLRKALWYLNREVNGPEQVPDPLANGMAFALAKWLGQHMRWSARTFGPNESSLGAPEIIKTRLRGLLQHLQKELVEIEDSRGLDLNEWIDLIILAVDGAWRCAGASPAMIIDALIQKQQANFERKWPPLEAQVPGEPVEHVR